MIRWTHIMIHHSATVDSETFSWNAIHRYHVDEMGWSDIGYHYGIENVNGFYEALIGRPVTMPGAHCKGMNDKAIGICCVGNYDITIPNVAMLDVLSYNVIKPLMAIFEIPKENIVFHNEHSEKTCPGRLFDKNHLIKMLV